MSSATKKTRRASERSLAYSQLFNGDSYITMQLRQLREDIVESADGGQFSESHHSAFTPFVAVPGLIVANGTALSQSLNSVNALYCEKMHGIVMSPDDFKGFQAAPMTGSSSACERRQRPVAAASRASQAVFMQTCFRSFAVFSQGILAGLALAHCITVFLLASGWSEVVAALPPRLMHMFYSLILCLTYICFVSACDRCDLCRSSGGLINQHSLHMPWSAGLYLASLSMSLVCTRVEIILAHRNAELPPPHQTGGIGWYAWLCLARTLANIFGWLATISDPHTDALLNRLTNIMEEERELQE